jgi:hypothetical protein
MQQIFLNLLIGLIKEQLIKFKIKVNAALAGHFQLLEHWKELISLKLDNY